MSQTTAIGGTVGDEIINNRAISASIDALVEQE